MIMSDSLVFDESGGIIKETKIFCNSIRSSSYL